MTQDQDTMELTSNVGDSFSLLEGVTVRVLAVEGSRVRLGIEAPRSVPVHRAERKPKAGDAPPAVGPKARK